MLLLWKAATTAETNCDIASTRASANDASNISFATEVRLPMKSSEIACSSPARERLLRQFSVINAGSVCRTGVFPKRPCSCVYLIYLSLFAGLYSLKISAPLLSASFPNKGCRAVPTPFLHVHASSPVLLRGRPYLGGGDAARSLMFDILVFLMSINESSQNSHSAWLGTIPLSRLSVVSWP